MTFETAHPGLYFSPDKETGGTAQESSPQTLPAEAESPLKPESEPSSMHEQYLGINKEQLEEVVYFLTHADETLLEELTDNLATQIQTGLIPIIGSDEQLEETKNKRTQTITDAAKKFPPFRKATKIDTDGDGSSTETPSHRFLKAITNSKNRERADPIRVFSAIATETDDETNDSFIRVESTLLQVIKKAVKLNSERRGEQERLEEALKGGNYEDKTKELIVRVALGYLYPLFEETGDTSQVEKSDPIGKLLYKEINRLKEYALQVESKKSVTDLQKKVANLDSETILQEDDLRELLEDTGIFTIEAYNTPIRASYLKKLMRISNAYAEGLKKGTDPFRGLLRTRSIEIAKLLASLVDEEIETPVKFRKISDLTGDKVVGFGSARIHELFSQNATLQLIISMPPNERNQLLYLVDQSIPTEKESPKLYEYNNILYKKRGIGEMIRDMSQETGAELAEVTTISIEGLTSIVFFITHNNTQIVAKVSRDQPDKFRKWLKNLDISPQVFGLNSWTPILAERIIAELDATHPNFKRVTDQTLFDPKILKPTFWWDNKAPAHRHNLRQDIPTVVKMKRLVAIPPNEELPSEISPDARYATEFNRWAEQHPEHTKGILLQILERQKALYSVGLSMGTDYGGRSFFIDRENIEGVPQVIIMDLGSSHFFPKQETALQVSIEDFAEIIANQGGFLIGLCKVALPNLTLTQGEAIRNAFKLPPSLAHKRHKSMLEQTYVPELIETLSLLKEKSPKTYAFLQRSYHTILERLSGQKTRDTGNLYESVNRPGLLYKLFMSELDVDHTVDSDTYNEIINDFNNDIKPFTSLNKIEQLLSDLEGKFFTYKPYEQKYNRANFIMPEFSPRSTNELLKHINYHFGITPQKTSISSSNQQWHMINGEQYFYTNLHEEENAFTIVHQQSSEEGEIMSIVLMVKDGQLFIRDHNNNHFSEQQWRLIQKHVNTWGIRKETLREGTPYVHKGDLYKPETIEQLIEFLNKHHNERKTESRYTIPLSLDPTKPNWIGSISLSRNPNTYTITVQLDEGVTKFTVVNNNGLSIINIEALKGKNIENKELKEILVRFGIEPETFYNQILEDERVEGILNPSDELLRTGETLPQEVIELTEALWNITNQAPPAIRKQTNKLATFSFHPVFNPLYLFDKLKNPNQGTIERLVKLKKTNRYLRRLKTLQKKPNNLELEPLFQQKGEPISSLKEALITLNAVEQTPLERLYIRTNYVIATYNLLLETVLVLQDLAAREEDYLTQTDKEDRSVISSLEKINCDILEELMEQGLLAVDEAEALREIYTEIRNLIPLVKNEVVSINILESKPIRTEHDLFNNLQELEKRAAKQARWQVEAHTFSLTVKPDKKTVSIYLEGTSDIKFPASFSINMLEESLIAIFPKQSYNSNNEQVEKILKAIIQSLNRDLTVITAYTKEDHRHILTDIESFFNSFTELRRSPRSTIDETLLLIPIRQLDGKYPKQLIEEVDLNLNGNRLTLIETNDNIVIRYEVTYKDSKPLFKPIFGETVTERSQEILINTMTRLGITRDKYAISKESKKVYELSEGEIITHIKTLPEYNLTTEKLTNAQEEFTLKISGNYTHTREEDFLLTLTTKKFTSPKFRLIPNTESRTVKILSKSPIPVQHRERLKACLASVGIDFIDFSIELKRNIKITGNTLEEFVQHIKTGLFSQGREYILPMEDNEKALFLSVRTEQEKTTFVITEIDTTETKSTFVIEESSREEIKLKVNQPEYFNRRIALEALRRLGYEEEKIQISGTFKGNYGSTTNTFYNYLASVYDLKGLETRVINIDGESLEFFISEKNGEKRLSVKSSQNESPLLMGKSRVDINISVKGQSLIYTPETDNSGFLLTKNISMILSKLGIDDDDLLEGPLIPSEQKIPTHNHLENFINHLYNNLKIQPGRIHPVPLRERSNVKQERKYRERITIETNGEFIIYAVITNNQIRTINGQISIQDGKAYIYIFDQEKDTNSLSSEEIEQIFTKLDIPTEMLSSNNIPLEAVKNPEHTMSVLNYIATVTFKNYCNYRTTRDFPVINARSIFSNGILELGNLLETAIRINATNSYNDRLSFTKPEPYASDEDPENVAILIGSKFSAEKIRDVLPVFPWTKLIQLDSSAHAYQHGLKILEQLEEIKAPIKERETIRICAASLIIREFEEIEWVISNTDQHTLEQNPVIAEFLDLPRGLNQTLLKTFKKLPDTGKLSHRELTKLQDTISNATKRYKEKVYLPIIESYQIRYESTNGIKQIDNTIEKAKQLSDRLREHFEPLGRIFRNSYPETNPWAQGSTANRRNNVVETNPVIVVAEALKMVEQHFNSRDPLESEISKIYRRSILANYNADTQVGHSNPEKEKLLKQIYQYLKAKDNAKTERMNEAAQIDDHLFSRLRISLREVWEYHNFPFAGHRNEFPSLNAITQPPENAYPQYPNYQLLSEFGYYTNSFDLASHIDFSPNNYENLFEAYLSTSAKLSQNATNPSHYLQNLFIQRIYATHLTQVIESNKTKIVRRSEETAEKIVKKDNFTDNAATRSMLSSAKDKILDATFLTKEEKDTILKNCSITVEAVEIIQRKTNSIPGIIQQLRSSCVWGIKPDLADKLNNIRELYFNLTKSPRYDSDLNPLKDEINWESSEEREKWYSFETRVRDFANSIQRFLNKNIFSTEELSETPFDKISHILSQIETPYHRLVAYYIVIALRNAQKAIKETEVQHEEEEKVVQEKSFLRPEKRETIHTVSLATTQSTSLNLIIGMDNNELDAAINQLNLSDVALTEAIKLELEQIQILYRRKINELETTRNEVEQR